MSSSSARMGVPSATAAPDWSVPSASTSALNPTLQKFTVILMAFVLLAWLMHWIVVAKRVAQLWRAMKRQNVVRVENAAAAAQLSRDDLLTILRSRSSLHIEAVDSVRLQGHVHTKMCRIKPVTTVAAAGTAAASSHSSAASSTSAVPAAAAAADGPSCTVTLRVSGTAALRVDVYAGVSVRLVQQLYAQHDKFLARPTAAAAAAGHCSTNKPRRSASPSPAASSGSNGLSNFDNGRGADQIELAVLESSNPASSIGGPSALEAEEAHSRFLRSYVLDTLVEQGVQLQAQQSPPLLHWGAPNGAGGSRSAPLFFPGEYAWKSSSVVVQPPVFASSACNCSAASSSSGAPVPAPSVSFPMAPSLGGATAATAPFQREVCVPVPQALLASLCRDIAAAAGLGAPPAGAGAPPRPSPSYPLLMHISPLDGEAARLLGAIGIGGGTGLASPLAPSPHVCPSPSCPLQLATPPSHSASTPAPALASASSSPRGLAATSFSSTAVGRQGPGQGQVVSEITVVELVLSPSSLASDTPAVAGAGVAAPLPPPRPDASPSSSSSSSSFSDAQWLAKLKFEKQLVLATTFAGADRNGSGAREDAAGALVPDRSGSPSPAAAAAGAQLALASPRKGKRSGSSSKARDGASARHAVYELEELYDLHTAVSLPPLPAGSASPATPGGADTPAAAAPAEDAEDADHDCVVCMGAVKDVVLLPCRHVCLCHACHENVNKCPVCRSPIQAHLQFVEPAVHSKHLHRRHGQASPRKNARSSPSHAHA